MTSVDFRTLLEANLGDGVVITPKRHRDVHLGMQAYVDANITALSNTIGGFPGIYYEQGGNTFGATGILGLNDNYDLNIVRNSVNKITLGTSLTTMHDYVKLSLLSANVSGTFQVLGRENVTNQIEAVTITPSFIGAAPASGSANYIQAQTGVAQLAAFRLAGSGRFETGTNYSFINPSIVAVTNLDGNAAITPTSITITQPSVGLAELNASGLILVRGGIGVTFVQSPTTSHATNTITLPTTSGILANSVNGVATDAAGNVTIPIGITTETDPLSVHNQISIAQPASYRISGVGTFELPAHISYITGQELNFNNLTSGNQLLINESALEFYNNVGGSSMLSPSPSYTGSSNLPSTSGTLANSVNGVSANSAGAITIPVGITTETDPTAVKNQNASAQASANFWIDGIGKSTGYTIEKNQNSFTSLGIINTTNGNSSSAAVLFTSNANYGYVGNLATLNNSGGSWVKGNNTVLFGNLDLDIASSGGSITLHSANDIKVNKTPDFVASQSTVLFYDPSDKRIKQTTIIANAIIASGTVQTVGATTTNVDVPIPTNSLNMYDIVIFVKDNVAGSDEVKTWNVIAATKDIAGTPTLLPASTFTVSHTAQDAGAVYVSPATINLSISGTDLRLELTSGVATTLDWYYKVVQKF